MSYTILNCPKCGQQMTWDEYEDSDWVWHDIHHCDNQKCSIKSIEPTYKED